MTENREFQFRLLIVGVIYGIIGNLVADAVMEFVKVLGMKWVDYLVVVVGGFILLVLSFRWVLRLPKS